MLKLPESDCRKVAVSSTLCPACAQWVEHRTDLAVAAVQTNLPDCIVTKLVANRTLVIHACTTAPQAAEPSNS